MNNCCFCLVTYLKQIVSKYSVYSTDQFIRSLVKVFLNPSEKIQVLTCLVLFPTP